MPPAFVLSQNQTLKLMFDNHPAGKREAEAGISGSRSCTNTYYCGYVRGHWSFPIGASSNEDPLRNGFNLPIERHPEVVADRGRRPHVPSSKPTMSKSRTPHLPRFDPGHRSYRLMRRERAGPKGGVPPVESHIWRSQSAVNGFFENFREAFGRRRWSEEPCRPSILSGRGKPNLQVPIRISRKFSTS